MPNNIVSIILAAGNGSRMQSEMPKFAHKIGDFQMIEHVLEKALNLQSKQIIIVSSAAHAESLKNSFKGVDVAVQEIQNGSASAVSAAEKHVKANSDIVLILYCDTPMISTAALFKMLAEIEQNNADLIILGFNEKVPNAYGRLVANNNMVTEIIEAKDLTGNQQEISLCNSGVMAVKGTLIWDLLKEVTSNNNSNEYYLTDIVKIANSKGLKCSFVQEVEGNAKGINTKQELAVMEKFFQKQQRNKFLNNGVTLVNPKSVYFSLDTKIGKDVIIHPHVVLKRGVVIENKVVIEAFSHIAESTIKQGAEVGPFARIRQNSVIGNEVKIGNFVEVKQSNLSEGVKAMHLSYLGDSTIGKKTNIGAGVITCNFDGVNKNPTHIGENCFVGSNVALVAPINLEDNSVIGAGSVITKDVKNGALAVTRSKQVEVENWAAKNKTKSRVN